MSPEYERFYDPARVAKLIFDCYKRAGYTKTRRDGEEVIDDPMMRATVVDLVTGKVAPDRQSRSENSWTAGELYAAVFPDAPGTDPSRSLDDLDVDEVEVRTKLIRRVWTLTNPGDTGFVQKRLGETGTTVLCRGLVHRGLDQVPGVYVTDDPELIMTESLQPRIDKLVTEAEHLRRHAGMITSRHGELASQVLAAIGGGVDRARAELGAGTNGAKALSRSAIEAPAS